MSADFNVAAFWAGVTAFIWYSFGGMPIHLAVLGQLDVEPAQASSWIFVIWTSGAIASLILTLRYRQPIPITWTIPGLVYLGTLAGQYSFAEIVGANGGWAKDIRAMAPEPVTGKKPADVLAQAQIFREKLDKLRQRSSLPATESGNAEPGACGSPVPWVN